MAIQIYPPNGAIIDTYTDIQREFLDNIKANGITEALDRLLPHKNGAELSLPAPIRFAWSGVADTFVFEISEAQDFFHSHTAKTTEPHLTLTNLKVGQKYYGRINGGEVFCFETKRRV